MEKCTGTDSCMKRCVYYPCVMI